MDNISYAIVQTPATTPRSLPAYVLLTVTIVILGFNWPLLAIGLESIGPWWMAAFRLAGGSVVIWTLVARRGRVAPPPRGDLPVVMSIGVFRLLAVLILVLLALQRVEAGRASVLVWTASMWTVPMAGWYLAERMNTRRWVGLAVGLAGIVVLVEPWRNTPSASTLIGYLLLLIAAVANAATAVHVRGHQWQSTPIELFPWQLAVATVPAVVTAWVIEGPPVFDWTPGLIAIIVYEGALATALAVWTQITVLRKLPSITTNLTLMLVPVLGVASSSLVLGEAITIPLLAGGSMIAIGVITAVTLQEILPDSTAADVA